MVSYCDPDTKLPLPGFNLREGRYGVRTYTVAAVIAGLRAAANIANLFLDTSLAEKYVPGNPWFISTLWLLEYYIIRAESYKELRVAVPYLEWCAKNALSSGVLAEQVHPYIVLHSLFHRSH